ncbi:MAG: hypothetical protein WCO29_12220 [Nostocales cyanobacterium ELA583]
MRPKSIIDAKVAVKVGEFDRGGKLSNTVITVNTTQWNVASVG